MFPTNFVDVCGNTGVSGGSDGVIRLWNLTARTRIVELGPRKTGDVPVPISAGSLSADKGLLAYGASYDWALGKDGYDAAMPKVVTVVAVDPNWVRR
jgi:hypothetical protein